jgi:tetratricopeptide (TPR) repeat protein
MKALLAAICLARFAGDMVGADQPGQWADQIAAAKEAQRRGQFAKAEAGFRSAIRLALETHPDEPAYEGASANELGQLYFLEGRFVMAENLFLRALARFRQIGDRAKQGRAAANLSTLYLETGQFSKAENTVRPCLDWPAGAIADLDRAVLSSNLGSVRAQQGRPEEAEKLFRAVMDSLQSRLDRDSNIVRAVAMDNVAALLAKTDRKAEGEALAYGSLAILEGFADSSPANLIRALANVAEFKILAGDLEGAGALYESVFSADQQPWARSSSAMRWSCGLKGDMPRREKPTAGRRAFFRILSAKTNWGTRLRRTR